MERQERFWMPVVMFLMAILVVANLTATVAIFKRLQSLEKESAAVAQERAAKAQKMIENNGMPVATDTSVALKQTP